MDRSSQSDRFDDENKNVDRLGGSSRFGDIDENASRLGRLDESDDKDSENMGELDGANNNINIKPSTDRIISNKDIEPIVSRAISNIDVEVDMGELDETNNIVDKKVKVCESNIF